jgi:starch synthase
VYPFSKTGGLADMVAALAKTLAGRGHLVGVVTPLYGGIREKVRDLHREELPVDVPLGVNRARGEVWSLQPAENLNIYFIDQPHFYQRAGIYQQFGVDYPDNPERFAFFSKAVTHLATHLPWKPQVVHLNDWQTGLVALLLNHQRQFAGWGDLPPTLMTVHNLAYQGIYPASQYSLANLPWSYFRPSGAEFYGQFNFLKTGIAFSKAITTVSPTYAREITTSQYGCALEGLLRYREASLAGIINGVDYDEWNPETDPHIARNYSAVNPAGKAANKAALQREFGLPADPDVPLFGNIGRMVDQKGVDILLGALEEMLSEPIQFVLLGSGSPAYQRAFRDLATRFPGKASVHIGFDEGLSHRIEAGSDFFLMPSRFEPCGLNQMYSLRYGTIPIVRRTGGLEDTVTDPRDGAHANGIKFVEYSSTALSKAIRKAMVLFSDRGLLERFQHHAMTADFSWGKTGKEYERIYRDLVGG